jgi:hypothetical protein
MIIGSLLVGLSGKGIPSCLALVAWHHKILWLSIVRSGHDGCSDLALGPLVVIVRAGRAMEELFRGTCPRSVAAPKSIGITQKNLVRSQLEVD